MVRSVFAGLVGGVTVPHVVWDLVRVGKQVHYISLTVNNQTYTVDTDYKASPIGIRRRSTLPSRWMATYKQQPFNVWLDEVNLLGRQFSSILPFGPARQPRRWRMLPKLLPSHLDSGCRLGSGSSIPKAPLEGPALATCGVFPQPLRPVNHPMP